MEDDNNDNSVYTRQLVGRVTAWKKVLKHLNSTKLENLKEMNECIYSLPNLNQNKINKLNKPITTNGIEAII